MSFDPRKLVIICLLALGSSSATATSSAFLPLFEQQLRQTPTSELLSWLQQQELYFSQDPEYNRWTAELALRENRLELAFAALERLIVQEPHNMGARLDLALVSFHTGDHRRSRQLLRSIPYESAPPGARQLIERLNALLPSARQGLQWHDPSLSLAAGYDSNVNIGSDRRDIPLNLWGQVPTLARLGDASLSQADTYAEVRLHSLVTSQQYPGWWWLGGFNHRTYASLSDFDQDQLWTGVHWLQPTQQRRLSLLFNHLRLGGTAWESGLQLDAMQTLSPQHLLQAGLEWSRQHQTRLPAQQTLTLAHQYQHGRLSNQIELAYTRRPQHTAGNLMQLGATLSHRPWPGTRLWLSYEHRQDASPFSPQFFGNIIRTDQTYGLGLSHTHPLPHPVELELHYQHTLSTIPLFDTRRLQLQVRVSFDL